MRRDVDIERIRALAAASGGLVGIVALPTPGHARFVMDLAFTTAGSAAYPREHRASSRLAIELAARHPFQPPAATLLTPIFHPHVFPSGLVCIGARWLPSEGMDLFVRRVIRLLAFDPLLMNPHSVAHAAAQMWYVNALRLHPTAFPSDRAAIAFAESADGGRDDGAPAQRVLRRCPHCDAALRLPAGRSGTVHCPRCSRDFDTAT